ncbi:MAG TPA: ABC transporter substrate-binding protein [Candidatus Binatia bacterium]|jgi:NitT/TauT family transport system substrate-binding protein|nr:ABC transporter substrate-binding protein [Candidatus Binatia bacterium]
MTLTTEFLTRAAALSVAAILSVCLLATETAAQTEVTMGVAFTNVRVAPLWVAEKEGFFKKNGIDIKIITIPGGTQGAQALLSGGTDISFTDPTSMISAIAAGAPVVEVMAITTIMPYYLIGAPDVKTVADLKGKRVGSSGLGLSASRLAILVAFSKLGLDPPRDNITLVAAGAEPERVAGLAAGAIGGTVVAPEFKAKIEELRLNILADLRTIKIPWEQDALETSRKFLETRRDVLERVIKSLLMANAYVLNPANKAAVIELVRTKLALKTAQEGESAYNDLTKFYVLKKPYPYKEGLQSIMNEVAKVVPKAATLKAEDVIDASLIEKLDKSGFIDGLYK